MTKTIECKHCKVSFVGHGSRKFCSDRCKWTDSNRKIREGRKKQKYDCISICLHCEKEFTATGKGARHTKYCSPECRIGADKEALRKSLEDPEFAILFKNKQRVYQKRHYNKRDTPERRAELRERNRNFRANNPEADFIYKAKDRAAKRGIYFDLTYQDIPFPKDMLCPALGIPIFPHGTKDVSNDYLCNLDRVDNSLGYVKGNVQVISGRANRIKSDATIDEIRSILAYMELHSPK